MENRKQIGYYHIVFTSLAVSGKIPSCHPSPEDPAANGRETRMGKACG